MQPIDDQLDKRLKFLKKAQQRNKREQLEINRERKILRADQELQDD